MAIDYRQYGSPGLHKNYRLLSDRLPIEVWIILMPDLANDARVIAEALGRKWTAAPYKGNCLMLDKSRRWASAIGTEECSYVALLKLSREVLQLREAPNTKNDYA